MSDYNPNKLKIEYSDYDTRVKLIGFEGCSIIINTLEDADRVIAVLTEFKNRNTPLSLRQW